MTAASTASPDAATDLVRQHLPQGAVVGTVSSLVGYVLTLAFVTVDGAGFDGADAWTFAGWVFYEAHGAAVEVETARTSITVEILGSPPDSPLATGIHGTVPEFVYLLVPVVVLVGAGALLVSLADEQSDAVGAAAIGASVAPGYLVPAVVGTLLFDASDGSGGVLAPDPLTGVLLVGIVYPVVLGAVGGVVGRARS